MANLTMKLTLTYPKYKYVKTETVPTDACLLAQQHYHTLEDAQ